MNKEYRRQTLKCVYLLEYTFGKLFMDIVDFTSNNAYVRNDSLILNLLLSVFN